MSNTLIVPCRQRCSSLLALQLAESTLTGRIQVRGLCSCGGTAEQFFFSLSENVKLSRFSLRSSRLLDKKGVIWSKICSRGTSSGTPEPHADGGSRGYSAGLLNGKEASRANAAFRTSSGKSRPESLGGSSGGWEQLGGSVEFYGSKHGLSLNNVSSGVFAENTQMENGEGKGSPAEARASESIRPELRFSSIVPKGRVKLRLDSFVADGMSRASRARVQASIRAGLVSVNNLRVSKVSHIVRPGDTVECSLIPPPPIEATPEDIALEIVYEDEYLLVVNKVAHMVVHPSPGHYTGTLVNALLHHCKLPPMNVMLGAPPESKGRASSKNSSTSHDGYADSADIVDLEDNEGEEEDEDEGMEEDDEDGDGTVPTLTPLGPLNGPAPVIRPGIVHRLDKGTSGLLVVAKDAHCHAELSEQFKARTARRLYVSLICGVPPVKAGRVEAAIGRDPSDRKRMAVARSGGRSPRSRSAASRYEVKEIVAGGGAALVEWRLETGRTHQIRVHAKHLGYPLLGDPMYGATDGVAFAALSKNLPRGSHGKARQLVAGLERPCLHAQTLGFKHPISQEELFFSVEPPADFSAVLSSLRALDLAP